MPTYRAFQVTGQRQFELVEREIVDPEPGRVRVRVLACGVCHSDFISGEGVRPDPSQPVVPGHEIIGVVDAVGPMSRPGRSATVSGWASSVVTAASALIADEAIS